MSVYGKKPNLQLWDWTTGQAVGTLPGHIRNNGATIGLCFSPGGHVLVSCGGDAVRNDDFDVRFWEVASRTLLRTFEAQKGAVPCLAVSNDGRLLASGGYEDNTVRVWDFFTGKEVAKFRGHVGPVNTVAFSPDGKMLASGSSDTTVLVWDTSRLKVEPPATDARPENLSRLWDALGQHESAKPFDALWSLVGAGDKAAAWFDKHLKPQHAPDATQLRRLLADLDNDDGDKREAASAELLKVGLLAEPALRSASGRPLRRGSPAHHGGARQTP